MTVMALANNLKQYQPQAKWEVTEKEKAAKYDPRRIAKYDHKAHKG